MSCTKLPLIAKECMIYSENGDGKTIAHTATQDDAEMIVTAVNAYEILMDALDYIERGCINPKQVAHDTLMKVCDI